MTTYKTPDVYVEEISTLPPSVAEVSTAIPAFIGYTEKGASADDAPQIARINTFLEYKNIFGGPKNTAFEVTVNDDGSVTTKIPLANKLKYLLYYGLDLYFKNGGGPCYIVSIGNYDDPIGSADFTDGLAALEKEDEPTIVVLPDAVSLEDGGYYGICNEVLTQCHKLGDRFGIFDVLANDTDGSAFRNGIRSETEYLKYGAAYTPHLQTSIAQQYNEDEVFVKNVMASYQTDPNGNGIQVTYTGDIYNTEPKVDIIVPSPPFTKKKGTKAKKQKKGTARDTGDVKFIITGNLLTITTDTGGSTPADIETAWATWIATHNTHGFGLKAIGNENANVTTTILEPLVPDNTLTATLSTLRSVHTGLYNSIVTDLGKQKVVLPPATAMAGVYATTDRNRGVWKAPANVSIVSITGPTEEITNREQENLNVDPTAGKSINAIRSFIGKGTLVWGARTLAGNDNEWRYVPVRRLFNTIEESCKKSTSFAVFEPNDANTWLKVKSMIDSYLYGLWQQGALAGSTPEDAYFVNVGLGKTMTSQDILEGRMIVEVGIAAVRPAEFIVLRFSHKLQEA